MIKQNSPLRILLWIFLFSSLFSACGGIEAREDIVDKVVTDQPTSILTETIAPTATITPTPEPTYTLCPEIKNFRNCVVTEEELLNGDYWNWLNEVVAPTLLEDFKAREDQIRDDIPIYVAGWTSGAIFFYPEDGGVYEDEETTAPWNRNVTFAITSSGDNDRASEYLIAPVFYYNKETQQVFPVVTVLPIWNTWGEKKEEKINTVTDVYKDTMNMPVIVFTSSPSGSFEKENITQTVPLISKFYERLGQEEVWKRTERFYNGDYSAFSSPDMIVQAAASPRESFQ